MGPKAAGRRTKALPTLTPSGKVMVLQSTQARSKSGRSFGQQQTFYV